MIVGHSNGGMVAQLFAATHPDRIAGIVLVDSAHEDQDLRAAELARSQLPPEEAEALIAGMTAKLPRLVDPEQFDHTLSRDQLSASRTTSPLPAVPMAVLVHGLPLEDVPPQLAEAYEPIWQEMQRQVAALVPGASYQVVVDATHDIHGDRPDVVANTIIDIVAAARDERLNPYPTVWEGRAHAEPPDHPERPGDAVRRAAGAVGAVLATPWMRCRGRSHRRADTAQRTDGRRHRRCHLPRLALAGGTGSGMSPDPPTTVELPDQVPPVSVPTSVRVTRRRRRPSGRAAPLPRSLGVTGRGWLIAMGLFVGWVILCAVSQPARRITDQVDAAMLRGIARIRTGWLTSVLTEIDQFLTGWTVTVVGVTLLLALMLLKRWRHLFTFLGGVVAGRVRRPVHLQRVRSAPAVRRHHHRSLGWVLAAVASDGGGRPGRCWGSSTRWWFPAVPGRSPRQSSAVVIAAVRLRPHVPRRSITRSTSCGVALGVAITVNGLSLLHAE